MHLFICRKYSFGQKLGGHWFKCWCTFACHSKKTTTKRKGLPWMCHCVQFSTHAFFHGKHMPPTPLSATRPDADWHSRPQICLSCLSTQCRTGPTHLQPLVFRHRLRHVVLPDHLDLVHCTAFKVKWFAPSSLLPWIEASDLRSTLSSQSQRGQGILSYIINGILP